MTLMVKVEPICAVCLLHRGYEEAELSTSDLGLRMRVMIELLKMVSERFSPNAVPAWLGAERDRLIRRITGCPDPYREAKRKSNEEALKLLPSVKNLLAPLKDPYERFRKACLIATAANAFEFGILGYSFQVADAGSLLTEAERSLVIDDTEQVFSILKDGKRVLYLLDNAGEVGFDLVLIEELKALGLEVRVVAKGFPILNDALLEDALFFGLDKVADELLTTENDEVGFTPEKVPSSLLDAYRSSHLIIAKGMGNYETLTEYPAKPPIVHLLKAKCGPIARSLGVPKGSLVVKLRKD